MHKTRIHVLLVSAAPTFVAEEITVGPEFYLTFVSRSLNRLSMPFIKLLNDSFKESSNHFMNLLSIYCILALVYNS